MTDPAAAPFRPTPGNLGLLVVDIQEKFGPAIPGFDALAAKAAALVRGFGILGMPMLATEQYPQGLGPTVKTVAAVLPAGVTPLVKKHFSCFGAQGFDRPLNGMDRSAVALCGVETHVCVYQTALDLLSRGFTVVAVADAMGSRNGLDHATALRRMEQCGVIVMTVEMLLFDLLRSADSPHFKEIQKLVK
jgi:nicotinamidase-related amidase